MVTNFFAGSTIDRAAHRRRDAEWLARTLGDPATRFVPVWRGQSLFARGETPTAGLLTRAEMESLSPARFEDDGLAGRLIYLGSATASAEERALFAIDLGAADAAPQVAEDRLYFADLRTQGALLPRDDGALLAAARGLIHWHGRHGFCGVCGHRTVPADAGHVRRCTDPACATVHFPRTDPAVIMLVTDGERALLGRQAVWAPGMYSTLAGFVEIGESLEDAVAREVFEEAGVRVGRVTYHSSQPWPFPASLMLGFTAEARTTDIRVDRTELEDARWFDRAYLRERARDAQPPAEGAFRLPGLASISRRLILDWIAG